MSIYNACIGSFQYILFVVDIICNIFDGYFGSNLYLRFSVYVIQDLAQIILLLILFLIFFHHKVLSNSQLYKLFKKHSISLFISVLYFILTIIVQFTIIRIYWKKKNQPLNSHQWINDRTALNFFVFQRLVSAAYYFTYFRASSGKSLFTYIIPKMVTPLYPSLNPRYIDPLWFSIDKCVDEEKELSALEKEHQSSIYELQQKYSDVIPSGGPNDPYEDDDEEEEEDNDDVDEESGSNDDDNDEELEADDLPFNPDSPIINLSS